MTRPIRFAAANLLRLLSIGCPSQLPIKLAIDNDIHNNTDDGNSNTAATVTEVAATSTHCLYAESQLTEILTYACEFYSIE